MNLCPLCKCNEIPEGSSSPLCSTCWGKVHTLAQLQQERDYLANWLNSRVHASGHLIACSLTATEYDRRVIRTRRDIARKMGLDWVHPPKPLNFAERMSTLLRLVGAKAIA